MLSWANQQKPLPASSFDHNAILQAESRSIVVAWDPTSNHKSSLFHSFANLRASNKFLSRSRGGDCPWFPNPPVTQPPESRDGNQRWISRIRSPDSTARLIDLLNRRALRMCGYGSGDQALLPPAVWPCLIMGMRWPWVMKGVSIQHEACGFAKPL